MPYFILEWIQRRKRVCLMIKSMRELRMRGIINRDFCDVQTVMKDGGDAIMSVGYASGENRIG